MNLLSSVTFCVVLLCCNTAFAESQVEQQQVVSPSKQTPPEQSLQQDATEQDNESLASDNAPTKDPLTSIYMIKIDSANKQAFEDALIAHMKFRAKQNEANTWQVYTQVIGEQLNMYMFRSCCTNWDKIAEHNAWAVATNTANHWRNNVAQYVADSARYFSRIDHDNSQWDSNKTFRYFGVETLTVAPGKGFAARAGIKAVSDAAKKMQWPESWAWHTRIGGEAQIHLVFGYDSYDDMMPPEKSFYKQLSEHLDSEEAAQTLISDYHSAFASSSYAIYVYRKGLSSPQ